MTEKPELAFELSVEDFTVYKRAVEQLMQQLTLRDQRLQLAISEREKLIEENLSRQRSLQALQLDIADKEQELHFLANVTAENEQLAQTKAELTAHRDRLAEVVDQLIAERDQLIQDGNRLSQQISQLSLENSQQSQQLGTVQANLEEHSRALTMWRQRALAAEANDIALRNTRSMRVITKWWQTKSSITQRVDHSVQRGRQLTNRSTLMLRTEGPVSVARQFGRWLGGERRYYGQEALVLSSNREQIEREQDADYRLAQRLALPHLAHGQESESPHNVVSQRPMEEIGKARLRTFLTMGKRLVFPAQKQPRVSIVIPVFNQAHFTYLTLENILSTVQALPYEVVIVDDGSTDETGELLDRLDNVRIHRNPANSGFGESCNRGVELAQGEYICFLNSDTLAMPGWLNTLVDTIESDPNCGAAGAKLIFPDMRLQEAGSIIWRDGSALGYGRGEAPFAPEFDYVREIDFCSAACLLVRTDLFKEIGGFDPRYAPAYYEDADLCMAIRRAGHTIIFAPRAVVFHLEHATSGRERAVALQLKNREIFVEKWREELSQYGMPTPANVLRYRDSRKAKRILILDDVVPLRQIGSGFPRTRALVAALAEAGYVITYLPTTDPRLYEPDTTELQTLGIEVLYGVTDIPALIHERGGMYDIVLVSRPHNAGLIAVARAANPQALIVYDAEAVFALREARQAEVEGKPLRAEIIAQQVQDELALAASADVVLTVSRLEQQTIQRAFPELAVAIWGHAIATRDTGVQFEEREGLAFIGYLASPPNNNAVLQLIREILPHVRQELPCSMIIGGDGATPEALEAAKRFAGQISWTGFVEDLGTILDHCRIFVAPHRFAAGIPLKVIEAMAYGVPCVISPLLAEQLGVTDNVEVLVGNDSKEFGDQVVRLYRDKGLWARLRKNSYTFIEQHYNLNAMKQSLVAMLGDGEAR